MDFWILVAAAGAGYVAQYLQSSSEDQKDNLLVDNKNLLHQLREKYCPFHKLARKRAKKEVPDEGVFRFRQLNLDSSDCTSDECAIQSKQEEYTSTKNKDFGGPFNSTGATIFLESSSKHRPKHKTLMLLRLLKNVTRCLSDLPKMTIFGVFDTSMTTILESQSNIGLQNGMALLYMGIVSGMMSAFIANRREIEKVNKKLKWTKNLVQELEKELNVKEIDNYSLSMSNVDEPTRQTSHVAAEKHESMSEIEAELEAELERLEMNLKVSSTFERISDFVELDSEDDINVAQGDLKVDCLNVQSSDSSESDSNTSGTWIVHSKPANYPVSPRELSSRLHEVIESRLEARIKELKTALLCSQNRACSLETQHNDFACLQSPYWYHETDEETTKIMYGSENGFDIDTSIPPIDGELIVL